MPRHFLDAMAEAVIEDGERHGVGPVLTAKRPLCATVKPCGPLPAGHYRGGPTEGTAMTVPSIADWIVTKGLRSEGSVHPDGETRLVEIESRSRVSRMAASASPPCRRAEGWAGPVGMSSLQQWRSSA